MLCQNCADVIATQGQANFVALKKSLTDKAEYISSVRSHKEYANLGEKLIAFGIESGHVNAVVALTGLNIGKVKPEEITLSILSELTQLRNYDLVGGASEG